MTAANRYRSAVRPVWRWGCRKCGAHDTDFEDRGSARRAFYEHTRDCPRWKPVWYETKTPEEKLKYDQWSKLLVGRSVRAGVVADWYWHCPKCSTIGGPYEKHKKARSEYRTHREGGCSEKKFVEASCFGHYDPSSKACLKCEIDHRCNKKSISRLGESIARLGERDNNNLFGDASDFFEDGAQSAIPKSVSRTYRQGPRVPSHDDVGIAEKFPVAPLLDKKESPSMGVVLLSPAMVVKIECECGHKLEAKVVDAPLFAGIRLRVQPCSECAAPIDTIQEVQEALQSIVDIAKENEDGNGGK